MVLPRGGGLRGAPGEPTSTSAACGSRSIPPGETVGHLQAVPRDDTWEVTNTAVRGDRARTGGSAGRCSSGPWTEARSVGVRRVVLATATADIGNLRFYQRCGFRMTHVVHDAFGPDHGLPARARGRRHPDARPGLVRACAVNAGARRHRPGPLPARRARPRSRAGRRTRARSPGADVHRLPHVDVAVFTDGPERDVFNNAVLAHGVPRRGERRGRGGRTGEDVRRRRHHVVRRVGARDGHRHAGRAHRARLRPPGDDLGDGALARPGDRGEPRGRRRRGRDVGRVPAGARAPARLAGAGPTQ